MKKMNIMTSEETISYIIKTHCSISRLGNGEMDIILGDNKHFQKYDQNLAIELSNLKSNATLLVCVPCLLENKSVLMEQNNDYYKRHRKETLYYWRKYYNKNILLGDSCLTRFYIDKRDTSGVEKYVKSLSLIWNKRSLTIVEGKYTRLGLGNNLFSNARSIKRILCPAENAYDKINTIENYIVNNIKKEELIILALGPTASVLAARLSTKGFQSLDLGHIDIEFEWFIRKAIKKIPIEGKYINELPNCWEPTDDVVNHQYRNEVIYEIK